MSDIADRDTIKNFVRRNQPLICYNKYLVIAPRILSGFSGNRAESKEPHKVIKKSQKPDNIRI